MLQTTERAVDDGHQRLLGRGTDLTPILDHSAGLSASDSQPCLDSPRNAADSGPDVAEQLGRIALRRQLADDDLDMGPVAGLDHHVDVGALDRDLEEQALVIGLDDVAAGGADDAGDPAQHPGHVFDLDPQPGDLAVADQAAHQDRGQDARVDVAAADDDADTPSGEAFGVGQHAGDAGGAGALGHQLLLG